MDKQYVNNAQYDEVVKTSQISQRTLKYCIVYS